MHVSEARKAANKANAQRSTGPKTSEGKAIARRNSLKHGMTGDGIVLSDGDRAEVESRVDAFHDELRPQTSFGSILLRKIATFSVRSERSADRENSAIAELSRKAPYLFDEQRAQRVDELFAALNTDPRAAVRNLRRMPEGVDRLLEAWATLRRELDRDGINRWDSARLARATYLSGVPHMDAAKTRIGELSHAIWGEFHLLIAEEGGGLDDQGRRDWARVELLKVVDAQIAELKAHRGTLDLDRIEQDRREAPIRLTFDHSKEACLARRYEADADRGFYKALKEYRQVEAEAASRPEAESDRPIADPGDPKVGSFREATPAVDRERSLAFLDDPRDENPVVRGADGCPLSITRPLSPPV